MKILIFEFIKLNENIKVCIFFVGLRFIYKICLFYAKRIEIYVFNSLDLLFVVVVVVVVVMLC